MALAACGAEEEETGGEVVIAQSTEPDALDPALAGSPAAWEPLWLVYTPLLTYRHAEGEEGAELVPGLAADLPEVSDDGLTYELTLRDGLEYSDGAEVEPGDFEHSIRRVLELESPGARYYDGIAGAAEYARGGEPRGDITGIDADDETREITITLTQPDPTFSNALALTFAGLVPTDTPFRDMTANPPPGVGPYELAEPVPNRSFVLEQSEGFEALDIPDIPTGNLARVTTRIVPSEREQAEGVLDGTLDYMQSLPPPGLRTTLIEQTGERYEEHPTASTYYLYLNHRTAPFDDPKVRAAVGYALDRRRLAQLYGDGLIPGCTALAPGVPGYDEELDTSACPYGDPAQPPDLERARELVSEAGADGVRVTVWGSDDAGAGSVAETYASTLGEIGLAAEPRIVEAPDYEATIGRQSTNAQTGVGVWTAGLPHPLDLYRRLDGASIRRTANRNLGNVDDPFINAELERLRREPAIAEVAEDWRELDAYAVGPDQAHLAPFGHGRAATFLSERLEPESAIFHPLYRNDYSNWELKEGE